MLRKNPRKAFILALLAVIFWSTSPTAFKLGLGYQDSYQLLTGASITSVVVLGLIILLQGHQRKILALGWRDLGFSAIMGFMNPVAYYLILFKAYTILPAQVAQPLNMVWPIVLVLISIPLLRQGISWKSIGAMILSFSGVVVVSLQGGTGGQDPENRLGIILALSTSVIWASYFIYNTRNKKDPVIRLFLNFLFASVYLLLGGLLKEQVLPGSTEGWLAAIYVGIFEMGITFVLWLTAMQYAPTTDRISNLVYIAPFLNLFIVNQVLEEKIFLTTVYGIILLVSGIVIQNLIGRHAKIS
ncbi:MAG: DMT family transporter [Bacteroidales bacterium]|nr:DMT family transporter [Bacteroidales bacterium]